jgi:hypothetical protein
MRHHLHTFTLVAGLLLAMAVPEARQATPSAAPGAPQPPTGPQQSSPGMFISADRNARETRERLRDVLDQYPPSVREVLRIDPTLLSRPDYLATYPVLAAFLEQHPEVAHNPAFFFGESRVQEENRNNPAAEAFRAFTRTMEQLTMVLVIGTITVGLIWLVRTVVEQRRWQRASRAQAELQTKLIDRFAASEDLLAYLQSPAGKTLTEMPALPQAAPRAMAAPLSRIFWSLQSGIVVGALGAGLIAVSGIASEPFFGQTLFGVGIVILSIGIGFAVSAAVSYVISQRLGLVQPLSARYGGEAPGS